jgi:hypothetical protein
MNRVDGVIDYPYKRANVKKSENVCGIQTPKEPYRVVQPDYRYVSEKLIIKPYTRSQKEAMLFNVKR